MHVPVCVCVCVRACMSVCEAVSSGVRSILLPHGHAGWTSEAFLSLCISITCSATPPPPTHLHQICGPDTSLPSLSRALTFYIHVALPCTINYTLVLVYRLGCRGLTCDDLAHMLESVEGATFSPPCQKSQQVSTSSFKVPTTNKHGIQLTLL